MSDCFDIVTVPDFSGAKRRLFEIRTLFFIAFWQEYGGRCRNFPLHLACIGEPPESVRRMAQQFGVRVTVHEPKVVNRGSTANKLRGFEVKRETDHLLLLDTDVMVMNDFSAIANYHNVIAASLVFRDRLPEETWRKVYAIVGVPAPTERVTLRRRSRREAAHPPTAAEASFPYYTSGVVSVPWSCPINELWAENLARMAQGYEAAPGEDAHWVTHADQVGFTVTVEQLRQRGVPFRLLDEDLHCHWSHLLDIVPLAECKLFHATHLFKGVEERITDVRQIGGIGPLWLCRTILRHFGGRYGYFRHATKTRSPRKILAVSSGILQLFYRHQMIYNKYCRPILVETGAVNGR